MKELYEINVGDGFNYSDRYLAILIQNALGNSVVEVKDYINTLDYTKLWKLAELDLEDIILKSKLVDILSKVRTVSEETDVPISQVMRNHINESNYSNQVVYSLNQILNKFSK